jgi:hypothetical protein
MDHETYKGFCAINDAPCELPHVAPPVFCYLMELDPESGHFCPDCFARSQYRQVYQEKDNPRGPRECTCGQEWTGLRTYLEDVRDTLFDLTADNAHEMEQEIATGRAKAWDSVGRVTK